MIRYSKPRRCLRVWRFSLIHNFKGDKWGISLFYYYDKGKADSYFLGASFKHAYIAFVCPWGMACLNRHGLTVDRF